MTILEFLDLGTGGQRQDLVAHADAVDGFARLHELLDMLYGLAAQVRVARAVRDEQTVKRFAHLVEVVVPRYHRDVDVVAQQAADDVLFHTHIDQADFLLAVAEVLHLLGRYDGHLVHQVRVFKFDVLATVKDNLALHRTLLSQHFSEFSGVDALDANHLLLLEPVGQRLGSIPVAVLLGVVAHHKGAHMNLLRLIETRKPIGIVRCCWDAIVSYQRKRCY